MELLDRWFDDDRAASDGDVWARSGAMALTGDRDGPVWRAEGEGPGRLVAAGRAVEELSARRGHPVMVDGCALLGERAALGGLVRQGGRSVGGLAEMVAAADGWVAVNLARPADVELLGALVGRPVDVADWPALAAAIGAMPVVELVARATDLGLPVAPVPEVMPEMPSPLSVAAGGDRSPSSTPLVVELAGLWAGPLCGDLLARAGCRVIKVETRQRPDGARRGNPAFFDVLNGAKESVVIDLDSSDDRTALGYLLDAADVVIEASRPRVMAQWGVDVDGHVEAGTVWVSITGYGRHGDDARRVGFGDDAAVAGGLVVPGSPPRFVADAAADPITGLFAAVAALACLDHAVGALVSAPLRSGAAYVAQGVQWCEADPSEAAAPRARAAVGSARPLGADTAAVLATLDRSGGTTRHI